MSRIPYDEIAFRSNKSSSGGVSNLGGSANSGVNRQFKLILRSARISKVAFAVFGSIGAGIPFLDYLVYRGPESLISAISLSLAISLAYVVFYSLQILPEFSNAQAFVTLYSLPLKEEEFSLLAVFSFVRTFDYLILGTALMQLFAIWSLTHSGVALLLMGLGALMNAVFAAAIALWFSNLFYKRVLHGASRSKTATLGRLFFLVVWGFAAMSTAFLFNILSYVLPAINDLLAAGFSNPGGFAISILHPFAISLAITNVIYPYAGNSAQFSLAPVFFLVPLLASLGYTFLAILVGKRTFASLRGLAHSKGAISFRTLTQDYVIKLRRPVLAQILKDLRLASKNPSMAFLYALPVFVVFMLALVTAQFPVMHATAVIVSTVVGCSFTIMISTTLLNTEGAGLEYSFSLPSKLGQIVEAKALVATLMFLPVPIALFFLGLSKILTSPYLLLIPVIEIIGVYSACRSEITFFFGSRKSHRGFSAIAGAGIGRLVVSLALAMTVFTLPLGVYSLGYVFTSSHPLSILLMLGSACVELWIVLRNAN